MHRWRAKGGIPALIVVIVLLVAGCGDDNESRSSDTGTSTLSTETADSPGEGESVPYALLEAPGWTLLEAFDPPPDHMLAGIEPVPSDWYAEYERLETTADGTNSEPVKVTGLEGGIDSYRSSMETRGMSFAQVDTSAGSGLTGTTAEQGARPVVVVLPFGSGTLELLSYELSSAELVDLVADVKMVDDAGWRAAGGQVG